MILKLITDICSGENVTYLACCMQTSRYLPGISLATYFFSNLPIASLNWFKTLLNLQLFQILLLTFLRDRKRLSVLGLGHK